VIKAIVVKQEMKFLAYCGAGYSTCETEVLLQQPNGPAGDNHIDAPGFATVSCTPNLSDGHATTQAVPER
jgi:hypothetical protein